MFLAYESQQSWWTEWLGQTVQLSPYQINRFHSVLMALRQAGSLQEFFALANRANAVENPYKLFRPVAPWSGGIDWAGIPDFDARLW